MNELQAIDYYYTVQGWLKAINNPAEANSKDVFAMQLEYFAGDYDKKDSNINNFPVTSNDYSGNIQIQSCINNGLTGAYQYSYDQQYQLIKAQWMTPNFSLSTLTPGNNLYDLSVNYADETGKLDGNGNIRSLKRHEPVVNNKHEIIGQKSNSYTYHYDYSQHPNALSGVDNYGSFTYDAIGRMITAHYDEPERSDMKLHYDVTSKVEEAYQLDEHDNPSLLATYTYDERGFSRARFK